jgi:hypothetical protein
MNDADGEKFLFTAFAGNYRPPEERKSSFIGFFLSLQGKMTPSLFS